MDAVWGFCWDRFGRRYSWAVFTLATALTIPVTMLVAWLVVRFEESDRYGAGVAIAMVGAVSIGMLVALPGLDSVWGQIEGWSAGRVDLARAALEATYRFTRGVTTRAPLAFAAGIGGTGVTASVVSGADAGNVAQWAVNGVISGACSGLIAAHGFPEAMMRPVRLDINEDIDVGDDLPRTRPTFAFWSSTVLLASIVAFALAGVLFGVVIGPAAEHPVVAMVITLGLLVFLGIPIALAAAFVPALRPLRDLAEATERVAAGDYRQRLPVVQDDDLGALVASFNRMQDGLAERERLQGAFGSYVDPALAERLLAQSDDLFAGDRVEVSVAFVDIRDFTPFAEANTAETTVAHLNSLFEIVVHTVNTHGGHVNKFLGDGALVVFGAPERLDDHADRAIQAATAIGHRVRDHFGGTVRVGIGVNTGTVIAGTIGGAGKLEFTLIGDAVNVAARVEQLTKTTGDGILLTQQTLDALTSTPHGLSDRGAHELRGKAEPITLHAINPHLPAPA